MTLGVHHIAINIFDPEPIKVLHKVTGFTCVAQDAQGMWFAAPNAFVLVTTATRKPGPAELNRRVCDAGITHFCIQSGDGTHLWQKLDTAGLAFNAPPVALGTGAIYAYGRDNEANVIEVEGVGDAPPNALPWIAHVAWASPDLDRLADFYARLVGRPVHNRGRFKNPLFEAITGLPDVDVRASWLMADNMIVELWQYLNPPTMPACPTATDAPGYRHVGFSSDTFGTDLQRINAAGITLSPAKPIADMPSFSGKDPDGNQFVILEAPPPGNRLSLSTLSAPDFVADRNKALLAANALA